MQHQKLHRSSSSFHKRYIGHVEFVKSQILTCSNEEEERQLQETLTKYITSTEKNFYENLKKNDATFDAALKNGLTLYEKYITIAFNFGKESLNVFETIVNHYFNVIEHLLDLQYNYGFSATSLQSHHLQHLFSPNTVHSQNWYRKFF